MSRPKVQAVLVDGWSEHVHLIREGEKRVLCNKFPPGEPVPPGSKRFPCRTCLAKAQAAGLLNAEGEVISK